METLIHIRSSDDERIAAYRNIKDAQLQKREGLFLVEGKQVVRRLLMESRFPIHSVLVLDKQLDHIRDLINFDSCTFPVYLADSNVMNDIVGFDFHRGIIALGERNPLPPVTEVIGKARTLVLLEGVTNPDNIGSIFRNAAGLGAGGLIIDSSCADPLYRMATRVSIGTSLIMPWTRAENWGDTLNFLREEGFTLIGMTPNKSATEFSELLPKPKKWALVLGAEGPGLSQSSLEKCDILLKLRMTRNVDSLNVATAAAIGMYQLI